MGRRNDTVPPRLLRAIERGVRSGYKRYRCAIRCRPWTGSRHPDADCDNACRWIGLMRECQGLNVSSKPFGQEPCIRTAGLRKKDRELLAAVARDHIRWAAPDLGRGVRQPLQTGVPCEMPIGIIEQFEPVDIDEK